ncbi:GNAT family N-acetyltransferase [Acinetobacter sp. TSRC1-2]|uniref:GNAT family N-acetyltransferase n=1 Tax=unclassified Acinetobacter TaxID=196816 RepID=UPI003CEE4B7C
MGNVYFSHQMKQSTASTEVIYLLLQACFEQGFRRVEWKCDELNQPSKRAAARFGFQYEGTFRQHRIVKGRNRNTAWFSILDEEWINLQEAYQNEFELNNLDAEGEQKKVFN